MIGNILAGIYGKPVPQGDFESIATITPSGSTATVTFTNIPQTYQHLQIRYIARDANASFQNGQKIRVGNGSVDSGANYAYHRLRGNGSAAEAFATSGANEGWILFASASAGTGTYATGVIDLLDYRDTNKFKTFRQLQGFDNNDTNGALWFTSTLWRSTSAIERIEISSNANFTNLSHFALYGIKG